MTDNDSMKMPPPLQRAEKNIAKMNASIAEAERWAADASNGSRAGSAEWNAVKEGAQRHRDEAALYASAARAEVALFATISANSERELYIEELEGANELAWGTLGKLAFILGVDLPRDPQANPREQCDEIVRVAREVMVEANGRSEDE